jgi:hypothetical protein
MIIHVTCIPQQEQTIKVYCIILHCSILFHCVSHFLLHLFLWNFVMHNIGMIISYSIEHTEAIMKSKLI